MSLYIKTGHKMIIFGTVIKEISFADELLRNNGYKISEIELFSENSCKQAKYLFNKFKENAIKKHYSNCFDMPI